MKKKERSALIKKYHLSEASQRVLDLAARYGKDHIGTEHLLYGLLFNPDVKQALSKVGEHDEETGIDVDHLLMLTVMYLESDENEPETVQGKLTPTTQRAFHAGERLCAALAISETTPLALLLGILIVDVGKGFLLIWEALTGDEPPIEEREVKKREVLNQVFKQITSDSLTL